MNEGRTANAAWVMLLALSMALHLWDLDVRSFHSDEAIHAQGAYNLLHEGDYRYDPTYHGPLLYYLTAASYALLGDSDFTARLPIALCGILAIALAYRLRRVFPGWTAWWAGLLFTISPTLLYYGRFLRMDLLELTTTAAALLCLYEALDRPATRTWVWFGVWTGLALATKENAYVTAVLVGFVFLLLLPTYGFKGLPIAAQDWVRRQGTGVAIAGLVLLLVAIPLYTVFFRHPGDWLFPIKAIAYWSNQHAIERVSGPPAFYLPRLALYEFLPLAAASIWVWRRGMRVRRIEAFLYLFGLCSILMYAYLGEKVPWLATHQIWAFLPLAGAQLAHTFGPAGRWWSRSLAAGALGATFLSAITANFVLHEITPSRARTEALMYVQTTPDLREIALAGLRLARQGEAGAFVAAVDGIGAWPLRWYWRHLPVWWSSVNRDLEPLLVVTDPGQEQKVRRLLGPGYVGESVPLRAWWLMDAQRPTLKELARYVFTRVPWGEIGASNILVLERRQPLHNSAQQVPTPPALAGLLPIEETLVFGERWLLEPRGIAVLDGKIAVADAGFSRIVIFDEGGVTARPLELPATLSEPEDVAWHPRGTLLIADTWNHRVLEVDVNGSEAPRVLDLPGPLYGPRNVTVDAEGRTAVVDTGNKRVLLSIPGYEGIRVIGGGGHAPGRLDEPVGAAWLEAGRLLVADVGNRRLQRFDLEGRVSRLVELPDAWPSYYSRPQVAVLREDLWLVTDPPNAAVWVVRGMQATLAPLKSANIRPAGIAWDAPTETIYMSDLAGRIWAFRTKLQ